MLGEKLIKLRKKRGHSQSEVTDNHLIKNLVGRICHIDCEDDSLVLDMAGGGDGKVHACH